MTFGKEKDGQPFCVTVSGDGDDYSLSLRACAGDAESFAWRQVFAATKVAENVQLKVESVNICLDAASGSAVLAYMWHFEQQISEVVFFFLVYCWWTSIWLAPVDSCRTSEYPIYAWELRFRSRCEDVLTIRNGHFLLSIICAVAALMYFNARQNKLCIYVLERWGTCQGMRCLMLSRFTIRVSDCWDGFHSSSWTPTQKLRLWQRESQPDVEHCWLSFDMGGWSYKRLSPCHWGGLWNRLFFDFFHFGICGSNEKCRFWSKRSQIIPSQKITRHQNPIAKSSSQPFWELRLVGFLGGTSNIWVCIFFIVTVSVGGELAITKFARERNHFLGSLCW